MSLAVVLQVYMLCYCCVCTPVRCAGISVSYNIIMSDVSLCLGSLACLCMCINPIKRVD